MDASKKIIQINPEYLKVPSTTKKSAKTREPKQIVPKNKTLKPSTIKKELMAKMREHQMDKTRIGTDILGRRETATSTKINDKLADFKDELKQSMEFLKNTIKEKQEKRTLNKTIARKPLELVLTAKPAEKPIEPPIEPPKLLVPKIPDIGLGTKPAPVKLPDEPKYGILKGGTKPLYSTMARNGTLKVRSNPEIYTTEHRPKVLSAIEIKSSIRDPHEYKRSKFETAKTSEIMTKAEIGATSQLPKIMRRRKMRRTFKLGRDKSKNKVSVLIKNTQTRKIINDEIKTLEAKPIDEVKRYLKENNLIKVGSNAPDSILRQIYISAMLSGEIKNVNGDVLIHNYLKDVEN